LDIAEWLRKLRAENGERAFLDGEVSDSWQGFLDHHAAERPGAPALSDTLGHHWSYRDLNQAAHDLADHLRSTGVRPGDRVLLLSENCAPAVAALFACLRLGAAIIPFNARQTFAEVSRVVDHAEPAAILCTSEVSTDAAAHAGRLGADEINGCFGALDLKVMASSATDMHDVAVILYTTGTTGDPKGVMLTHDNLSFASIGSIKARGLTANDVICGVLPMTHVFGLASIIGAGICAGALIRMVPRFKPEELYRALTSGTTVFSAVPQMHALLMQFVKEQGLKALNSDTLRYVSSGAAPLDPDWKRRAEAFFGIALQNGYGMTEATAGVCMTDSKIGDPDISVGKPFPGVQIRLDLEAPGAEGDVGEIQIRGANVMKGYFRNPEATAKAIAEDGWLCTGDLGRIDSNGNLHIMGRSKELIIHGGFNVYPPEVEAVLNEHPQVIQSAVIGKVVDGDELVIAFIEAAPDDLPDEEALRDFVGKRLTGYKRPSRIVITDKLPAAPTGKIMKHKLLQSLSSHDRRSQ